MGREKFKVSTAMLFLAKPETDLSHLNIQSHSSLSA